jgi:hypothetical protein
VTNPDPWAAASAATPASGSSASGGNSVDVPDRLSEYRALDPSANPFGTSDTIGGGGGIRGPQLVDLVGRLVVLKPIKKLLEQPVPEQPGQTQDFYVCDLTVLTGGTLTVITPERPAKGDQPALPEQSNDYEVPFTFPSWYAYGRAITVKLDNLTLPLYLGVVQRCPTGPGYRAGKTWRDSTREWDAYVEKLRKDPARAGAKPQFSWGLIDPDEEQAKLAMDWYRSQQ